MFADRDTAFDRTYGAKGEQCKPRRTGLLGDERQRRGMQVGARANELSDNVASTSCTERMNPQPDSVDRQRGQHGAYLFALTVVEESLSPDRERVINRNVGHAG